MTENDAGRSRLLRALKRERLHVERGALEASPPEVRRSFEHAWAPADLLLRRMGVWPAGLLGFWLQVPAGHVIFCRDASAYLPLGLPWYGEHLHGVARVSLADLLGDGRPALLVLAHLMDHLLGSRGEPEGLWLSDGAGATPRLQEVGRRLQSLVSLGYGPDEPHRYFASAFATYWLDRRGLSVADPHVERLLRTTVCSEAFWRQG